ncbi:MAG: hypothetical protein KKB31_02695 [Nanoarchaeota archaeon]|nr:hypothetical protein [Nanoarchaeota archaeon]
MVKGSTITIWILAIVLVLGVAGYFLFSSIHPFKASISEAYRTQIDRLSPGYLKEKELACTDHNGDWVESRTKVGCFNIGTDWDSSWCSTMEGTTVEDICNGISGTKWVCDQNNAGCMY